MINNLLLATNNLLLVTNRLLIETNNLLLAKSKSLDCFTDKINIEEIYEIDGEWYGDLIGYYAQGHIDVFLFFQKALFCYQEYQEEKYECGDVDEVERDYLPPQFKASQVKHYYYRYPTKEELDQDRYENELIIFTCQNREKTLNPMTSIYLE